MAGAIYRKPILFSIVAALVILAGTLVLVDLRELEHQVDALPVTPCARDQPHDPASGRLLAVLDRQDGKRRDDEPDPRLPAFEPHRRPLAERDRAPVPAVGARIGRIPPRQPASRQGRVEVGPAQPDPRQSPEQLLDRRAGHDAGLPRQEQRRAGLVCREQEDGAPNGATASSRTRPDASVPARTRALMRRPAMRPLSAISAVRLRTDAQPAVASASHATASADGSPGPCGSATRAGRPHATVTARTIRTTAIWPFPNKLLAEALSGSLDVVMVELNLGQVFREVQRVACDIGCGKVRLFSRVGGDVPKPSEIASFVRGGA